MVRQGFDLTIRDSHLTILVQVFTNHISGGNTYFTNHIEGITQDYGL